MSYVQSRINTTETARQNRNFRDLDLNFLAHPASGDLVKKTGVDAIKRSIRNLIYLHKGELGFRPNKGWGGWHALFETFSPATASIVSQDIYNMLEAYEPRVSAFNINIDEDVERNGITIDIHFDIKNYNEPQNLTVFLERVR